MADTSPAKISKFGQTFISYGSYHYNTVYLFLHLAIKLSILSVFLSLQPLSLHFLVISPIDLIFMVIQLVVNMFLDH